jgi:hypothetical protein
MASWTKLFNCGAIGPHILKKSNLQQQVLAKVEAFERFVNLNAIALGLLHSDCLGLSQTGVGDFSEMVPLSS